LLQTNNRSVFNESHELFRDQVRRFFAKSLLPNLDAWESAGIIDRRFWLECGDAGLLCPTVPTKYGGLEVDFAFNAVIDEELAYAGSPITLSLQSDIVCDYILNYGSEAQRLKWLPQMVRGEVVTAIAMTEPGTGSDLQAIQTSAVHSGDDYVVNGSKTYISNGQLADLVIVVAKTAPNKGSKGLSLILVEADRVGFSRGRNLDKIGQFSADTSELFFSDLRVPRLNCLGHENAGFQYLMSQLPQERLSIAISSQAHAQRAFDEAVKFTKGRKAFGKVIFDFQATRFSLATLACKLQVGWAHLDWAINRHLLGKLTGVEASAAKLFHTELQWECCDVALQLHGGAGYMNEYPIARLWRDARASRIYGGTSEIMKEVIGRAI
jgi:acyl-CoA dehydrogenase